MKRFFLVFILRDKHNDPVQGLLVRHQAGHLPIVLNPSVKVVAFSHMQGPSPYVDTGCRVAELTQCQPAIS